MSSCVLATIVYNEKPRAAAASKVRQQFLPINGREFSYGNKINFSIACGREWAFLYPKATYLKFKLTYIGDNNSLVVVDSANSAIHLREVYYGRTQLEYIREYAPLFSVLMDSQASSDLETRNGSILEGTTSTRSGDTFLANASNTHCIPLVSGIVGSMAENTLPIGALTRDPMKVSITLADHLDLLTQAIATTWKRFGSRTYLWIRYDRS
jgi:hypothetical protein